VSNHPITHVEFSAKDRKASQKFYADVFGWKFHIFDELHYTTFETGSGIGGGFSEVSESYPAGTVTVYIETDDVTASLAKVEAAGGIILATETEVPGTGKFGLFRDPTGNLVGLFNWFNPPK